MLSVIMLSVVMLSVVMLSVIMLSVVMLSFVVPLECQDGVLTDGGRLYLVDLTYRKASIEQKSQINLH